MNDYLWQIKKIILIIFKHKSKEYYQSKEFINRLKTPEEIFGIIINLKINKKLNRGSLNVKKYFREDTWFG